MRWIKHRSEVEHINTCDYHFEVLGIMIRRMSVVKFLWKKFLNKYFMQDEYCGLITKFAIFPILVRQNNKSIKIWMERYYYLCGEIILKGDLIKNYSMLKTNGSSLNKDKIIKNQDGVKFCPYRPAEYGKTREDEAFYRQIGDGRIIPLRIDFIFEKNIKHSSRAFLKFSEDSSDYDIYKVCKANRLELLEHLTDSDKSIRTLAKGRYKFIQRLLGEDETIEEVSMTEEEEKDV